MAELLGVIASGIAVAQISAQIGGSVLTLRKLWNDVKDVPDTINYLMSQIDVVNPILVDMESEFNKARSLVENDSSARLSMAYCRKATDNLAALVNDLSAQISSVKRRRRGIFKIKIALKSDVIAKYETRLRDAVQLLCLSQQAYVLALTRLQPSLIMAEFALMNIKEPQPAPPDKEEAISRRSSRPVNLLSEEPAPLVWRKPSLFGSLDFRCTQTDKPSWTESTATFYQARLQAPVWLASKAWDFQAYRAISGWKLCLRSYNAVPEDSLVFKYASGGRLPELLSLFDSGQASPFDRDPNGWTLLHYAALFGHTHIFKRLAEIGVSPLEQAEGGATALHCYPYVEIEERQSFLRFLLSQGYYDRYYGEEKIFEVMKESRCYFGDTESFTLFRDHVLPNFYDIPLVDRLEGLAYFHPTSTSAKVWEMFITQKIFDADVIRGVYQDCPSLLNVMCQIYFAWIYYWAYISMFGDAEILEWRALMQRVVAAIDPEDLHNEVSWIGGSKVTPMLAGLLRLLRWVHPLPRPLALQRRSEGVLRAWLEDLKMAGTDLQGFGRHEVQLFKQNIKLRESRWDIYSGRDGPVLVSFTYGPQPEDWDLNWDMQTEEFAGDFWQIIENPPMVIPGAWVEDGE